jgi:SAM-dependent methyltransferase
MSIVNTEQAEFWSDLAPTWLELGDRLEEFGGLPGRLAMDRLSPAPGETVLDIGCGTGGTTLELSARVTPGGSVLGVDIAQEMLRAARDNAARAGATNVEFLRADAQVEAFGDGTFDGAYSRFGVMFFSDPLAAFGNIRKALKDGALLCFACWRSGLENEWMLVPGMAAMSVVGELPLPAPDEPGPFSLAEPSKVQSILESAGYRQVEIEPYNDVVAVAEARIEELAATSMRVGAVRESLRDAPRGIAEQVRAAVESSLRDRLGNGEVRLSRGVNLVKART